jgi:radical SAM protein with 4Fe4S-binding SPASM domain
MRPRASAFPDLSWADEWARRVRDFVFVREEDGVFIQRPNKAFRLNASGVALAKRLLAGEPVASILAPWRDDPRPWRDAERFLLDLRRMLKGGIPDDDPSPAVERVPFTRSFSPLPVLSEVAVTYRCNAACVFCYAGCNCTANPVGNAREMTLDEVRRVLDRIAREAKVPSVSFTGGEATLREDLPDMVAHAVALGLRTNLVTNGLRAADAGLCGRLAAAGLHSAQVSVEGTTAEVHEAITRVPGSFARTLEGLGNLRAAGLRVHTNTTICRENAHQAAEYPRFAKGTLRLERFSMNLVIPTGSAPVRAGAPVRYREVAAMLPRVQAASREAGIEFLWYSPTPLCLFNPVAAGLGNKGCAACDGLLSVGADGRLLPCASYDRPLGSLVERPFAEVWASPEAREFRDKGHAPPGCRDCEDFDVCQGACPLYWRALGTQEIEEARA